MASEQPQFRMGRLDHDEVRAALVDADGVEPVRYWPATIHESYRSAGAG